MQALFIWVPFGGAVLWRHRLPYMTPSTKTNDNKSQRSSLIWQFSNKECLLCQKRLKDGGGIH